MLGFMKQQTSTYPVGLKRNRMRKVPKTKVVATTIHSLKKDFWCAYHEPDSILGARDITVNLIAHFLLLQIFHSNHRTKNR
jgi:hypothetical protein